MPDISASKGTNKGRAFIVLHLRQTPNTVQPIYEKLESVLIPLTRRPRYHIAVVGVFARNTKS